MSDAIIVKIDLDASGTQKEFQKIEKAAESTYVKIGNGIEKNLKLKTEEATSPLSNLFDSLKKISTLVATAPPVGKGLFGFITSLSFTSNAIDLVGEGLLKLDNILAKKIGKTLKETSFLLEAISFAITFGVTKIAQISKNIGTSLVNSLKDVSKQALNSRQTLDTLLNVITNFNKISNGAVGSTKSWADLISSLSKRFNILSSDLQKGAQEIILVGTQIGLTEDQLKKLLIISSEYAKINKKELFPVALALVKALNGQSVAAQTLGVKLTESAVSAFALKNGLTKNFSQLTDNSKAQVRYSKLLSQYTGIAGIADNISNSLADSQNKLKVTVDNLKTSFGEGVAIVENYNLVSFLLGKATSIVSDEIFKLSGFLSAVGARFLQITGFIIEYSFKAFFLLKIINALNIALASKRKIFSLLNTQIPLVNKSLAQLIDIISGGNTSIVNISNALGGFGAKLNSIILAFKQIASSPIKGFFSVLSIVISTLVSSVKKLSIVFLAFLPIVLKIGAAIAAIIGIFTLIKNAFVELEKRTQVFSKSYDIIANQLAASSAILQPLIDIFTRFRDIVIDIAQRAFGLLVAGISKVVSLVAGLIAQNPFGIFSQSTIASFNAIKMQLDSFNNALADNGYKLGEYSQDATRKIASIKEPFKEVTKEVDQFAANFAQTIENGVVDVITDGVSRIGAALNQGESAWSNFSSQVLNIIGDMAINLGKALVAKGLAIDALRASLMTLSGGAAIAAGLGLIALGGLLKSFAGDLTDAAKPSGGGLAAAGADSPQETTVMKEQELERQAPQQNVEIVVQGSLVQQEELGKFIADTLTDVGAKNGISVFNTRFA